jgi:hypothetical protein
MVPDLASCRFYHTLCIVRKGVDDECFESVSQFSLLLFLII